MSSSISGPAPVTPAAGYFQQSTAQSPAPVSASSKTATEDSVQLSQSAQVSLLSTQGQTPTEISDALGIPLATVNSDLGIVTASTAQTGAPQAAAPQVSPAAKTTPAPLTTAAASGS